MLEKNLLTMCKVNKLMARLDAITRQLSENAKRKMLEKHKKDT